MLNIRIGGQAGQGINTIAKFLAKSLLRNGFYVFTSKDYMSRIRGGHNFSDVRLGSRPLGAAVEKVDILLALDETTWSIHQEFIQEDGLLLYDEDDFSPETGPGIKKGLPLKKKAEQFGDKRVAGVIALGLIHRALGIWPEVLQDLLAEKFKGSILEQNLEGLTWGHKMGEDYFSPDDGHAPDESMLISGNDALGMGAVAAGVQFYSAYPMTPATGVMNFLAGQAQKFNILVEQAEDEIAAINMALGAAYGGVRAMTGTSGGGFSLMVEGLGLAGMTETPLVIVNGQRPGPATGLPTRTEQGDLEFVIHASQGEFPRIVLAPRQQGEAFYQVVRAFNLADEYQVPVIVMSDQFLADSEQTIEELSLSADQFSRGKLIKDHRDQEPYLRYKITDDGISPRLIPGEEGQVVMADSDEHNQAGNIIEDAATRRQMMEKRMKRLEIIKENLEPPLYHGAEPEEAQFILVSWGSTYGPLEEARLNLEKEGFKLGHYSFQDLWPLPPGKWQEILNRVPWVLVENNYTGQLGSVLSTEGIKSPRALINKYDGRPFKIEELQQAIKREVNSHGQ